MAQPMAAVPSPRPAAAKPDNPEDDPEGSAERPASPSKARTFNAHGFRRGFTAYPPVLTEEQREKVIKSLALQEQQGEEDMDADEHTETHHGHGPAKPSILKALVSASINFILMFGLCCVYGIIMFDGPYAQHQALGVKMNLASAMIAGIALALGSSIQVAIGGPDLNPVVFLGIFVTTIGESLKEQFVAGGGVLPDPDARRRAAAGAADDARRRASERLLAAAAYAEDPYDTFQDEVRATAIFATAFSTIFLAVLFYLIGKFKLSKVVSFVPTSIIEAFLSCVGYKVFAYALKLTYFKPYMFLPAMCLGIPLYFLKAYHVGDPAIVIPTMLIFPLIVFYAVVFGGGWSIEDARENKWMFPEMVNEDFYLVWTDSIMKPENININAWLATLPDFITMIILVTLDCMLKLSATESKLPVKVPKDDELRLVGKTNSLMALCGTSVGYMQLKFNVMNYGIIGTVTDRRAGVIYAILCAVCYFWTIDLFNYLPRFFLSMLLFFAGAGFIAENLWGSRVYLTASEWVEILCILVVFIVSGQLVMAVGIGMLIMSFSFLHKYAKVSCLAYVATGDQDPSTVRRNPMVAWQLRGAAAHWVQVMKLKGFLFFGSSDSVTGPIISRIEKYKTDNTPEYKRMKFLVFDISNLDGMDASACKALCKVIADCGKLGIEVLWGGAKPALNARLTSLGLTKTHLGHQACFEDPDGALRYAEDRILVHLMDLQKSWAGITPEFQAFHKQAVERFAFEPFPMLDHSARRGLPYEFCKRERVERLALLDGTSVDHEIMLVHRGRVALYPAVDALTTPLAVYTAGFFLGARCRHHTSMVLVALEDCEVLVWTLEDVVAMRRHAPAMEAALEHALSEQMAEDANFWQRQQQLLRTGTVKDTLSPPEDLVAAQESGVLVRRLREHGVQWDREARRPPLPGHVQEDLWTTFAAYKNTAAARSWRPGVGVKEEPDGKLEADVVASALAYAGITYDPREEFKDAVSASEFCNIAHRHSMSTVDGNVMDSIKNLSKNFNNPDGSFDIDSAEQMLDEVLDMTMEPFKLESLFKEADTNDNGLLDSNELEQLVSRLKMSVYYEAAVEKAMEAMQAKSTVRRPYDATGGVVAEDLVAAGIDGAQAEEMVWLARLDWPETTEVVIPDQLCFLLGTVYEVCFDAVAHPRLRAPKLPARLALPFKQKVEASDEGKARNQMLKAKGLINAHTTSPSVASTSGISLNSVDIKTTADVAPWKKSLKDFTEKPLIVGFTTLLILASIVVIVLDALVCTDSPAWLILEIVFTTIFAIEIALRFLSCEASDQTKTDFILNPTNICDLLALLPLFIDLVLGLVFPEDEPGGTQILRFLRMARLLRLTRIMRLQRYRERMKIVGPICMIFTVSWGIFLLEKDKPKYNYDPCAK